MNVFSLRPPSNTPAALTEYVETFRGWFGDAYDLDVPLASAAVIAAHRCLSSSDPAWLQIVGSPGSGKTQVLMALAGSAVVVSDITAAGLLSGTPARERTKDATGGLLNELNKSGGELIFKDFTTVLSMPWDKRNMALAGLREAYDQLYVRGLGADGARRLTWAGRIVILSAVTPVWDRHHGVISELGDRFLLLRMNLDSETRATVARQSHANEDDSSPMRQQLRAAADHLLSSAGRNFNKEIFDVDADRVTDELVKLSLLTSWARSGTEYNSRGDPVEAYPAESPARIVRQFKSLFRGCRIIGLEVGPALHIVRRVAYDCIPLARRRVLDVLTATPGASALDVYRALPALGKWKVDRTLTELVMHGMADVTHVRANLSSYRVSPMVATNWLQDASSGKRGEELKSQSLVSPEVAT